jgi:phosphate transport system substrate-binding protein
MPFRILLAVMAFALVAAACDSDSTTDGNGTTDPGTTDQLSGSLEVSGSSTVEPISALVAEKFQSANPDVSISVDGPGTTDGMALFCEGKIPVADASRAIDPAEEVPACEKNGVNFIELKIGIDGITILTSPDNNAVDCLSFADLYALLGPESKGFAKWSDAQSLAAELGSKTQFPDEDLVITGPGEESGTWGSLIDLALKGIGVDQRGLDEVTTRPDYQSSANDNVIIQGVEGAPYSLGWVGFAYYEQNQGAVKAIPVAKEANGECVEPTVDTIADKSYPLSRDLYIYVNADEAANNPAVSAFVDFYLSDEGLASVSEVGYVDEPADVISQTVSTWESKTTGSQAG